MARARRRSWRWTLAAVLLTAGCASSVSPAAGGSPSAADRFAAFLASVSAARYQNYAGKPGVRVRDADTFEQMRAYILTRYQGAQVAQTFVDGDGAVFDCIRQATAASSAARTAAGCPPGTVPTRRITLSDLVRFPTLQQFFGKSPGGTGQLPLPPTGSP